MPQPIPLQPNTYPTRILLSVIGLTPQVITETIYALSQQDDAFIPTQLHVITTQEGYNRTRLTLLGEQTGWLNRLCQDYQLPAIQFNETHIHVLTLLRQLLLLKKKKIIIRLSQLKILRHDHPTHFPSPLCHCLGKKQG